ncbi:hypothetical protein Godav_013934 [Gossypium davidsonii]|uniref:Ycf2 N-terminal domain-containing protein n=1 Tax=Gossypium davidsonii TaxID=34287 RepID=A0A7J8RJJ0_GOSDV|nr:hypothetical protein [Gossypium davidsonii]
MIEPYLEDTGFLHVSHILWGLGLSVDGPVVTEPMVVGDWSEIFEQPLGKHLNKSESGLVVKTERSMNRDPNVYRYKWSNGSKNFQEHLEHFVSEQKSHFQVVFDRLRINQYSIDWSEVIDEKDLSNFGNIPIHRSKINIYELKGLNHQLYNQLLEPIGFQIVHLKKLKPFLLDDHNTPQKTKILDQWENNITIFGQ